MIDLYDVALEGTFLSDLGREECPLCGYPIRPDDPVVAADIGEVHSHHLTDQPENCVLTEYRDRGVWLLREAVILGSTQIGSVVLKYDTPTYEWHGISETGGTTGPHKSKDEAARALVDMIYPKKES